MKKIAIISATIILTCISLFLIFKERIAYTESHSSEIVKLLSGENITLNKQLKGPRGFSIPFIVHGSFSLSDEPFVFSYDFEHKGEQIKWKGRGTWLLLNYFEEEYYVWAWNIFSGSGYSASSLFRYDQERKTWDVIDRSEFPKAIAVKNLNLNTEHRQCKKCGGYTEKDLSINLDPTNPHFDETSTAHLWLFLETGTHLRQPYWEVDAKILKNFKEKYINQNVPIH